MKSSRHVYRNIWPHTWIIAGRTCSEGMLRRTHGRVLSWSTTRSFRSASIGGILIWSNVGRIDSLTCILKNPLCWNAFFHRSWIPKSLRYPKSYPLRTLASRPWNTHHRLLRYALWQSMSNLKNPPVSNLLCQSVPPAHVSRRLVGYADAENSKLCTEFKHVSDLTLSTKI